MLFASGSTGVITTEARFGECSRVGRREERSVPTDRTTESASPSFSGFALRGVKCP
jgi:hypothetical protein